MRDSAASPGIDRVKTAGFALVLLIVGFALYAPILRAPFFFDDKTTIANNERIKNLSLALREFSNRRFVSYLSFALNYSVHDMNVAGYHIVNIVLHIVNAFLVFSLCRVLARSCYDAGKDDPPVSSALIASALFLVHPVQTQSVSYITQRMTVLATFFYLATVLLYLLAKSEAAAARRETSGRMPWAAAFLYAGALFCAAAAMKSKEIAATLPVALAVAEWFFGDRSQPVKKRMLGILPFCVLPLLLYVKMPVQASGPSVRETIEQIDTLSRDVGAVSRTEYASIQSRVVITYLRLLFFPFNQTLLYEYPLFSRLPGGEIVFSFFCIAVLAGIGVVAYSRHKMVSFGIAWFFIALLVESSVVPIKDVINEHRLYLPSAGIFIAFASTASMVLRTPPLKLTYVLVVMILLSLAAYARNTVWADPELVWADAIRKAPGVPNGYNNLGVVYKEKGDYLKAEEMFGRALNIAPGYVPALYNIGDIAYKQGNYNKALTYLTASVQDQEGGSFQIDVLNKLGRTYGALGQYGRAIETFRQALKKDPYSIVLLNNLGVQYIKAGQPEKAVEIYEDALQRRPDYSIYLNLSIAYAQMGNEEKSKLMWIHAVDMVEKGNHNPDNKKPAPRNQ